VSSSTNINFMENKIIDPAGLEIVEVTVEGKESGSGEKYSLTPKDMFGEILEDIQANEDEIRESGLLHLAQLGCLPVGNRATAFLMGFYCGRVFQRDGSKVLLDRSPVTKEELGDHLQKATEDLGQYIKDMAPKVRAEFMGEND